MNVAEVSTMLFGVLVGAVVGAGVLWGVLKKKGKL